MTPWALPLERARKICGAGNMIWRYLIEGPWIAFVTYWVAGALKTRRTVSQESFVSRYGILFLEIIGFALVFSDAAEIGVLGHRVLHRTYVLGAIRTLRKGQPMTKRNNAKLSMYVVGRSRVQDRAGTLGFMGQ
jgi:hypothetical protein